MPRRRPEHPRQRRYDPLMVLSYVVGYQQRNAGRTPSQRRIQRDLDISAPSVVHMILHRLARRDLLIITTYGRGFPAELTVTEAGQIAAQRWHAPHAPDDSTADEP